jgi:hypothetical protein
MSSTFGVRFHFAKVMSSMVHAIKVQKSFCCLFGCKEGLSQLYFLHDAHNLSPPTWIRLNSKLHVSNIQLEPKYTQNEAHSTHNVKQAQDNQ